ncbi:UNVERIFIED_CONTAM: thymidylate kinase [Paenibacillus sp. PvR008]
MKIYQIKVFFERKLESFWYWLMTPLAYFFTKEKVNKRFERRKSKMTREQMVRWIAEDIARYLIQNKKSDVEFLVCTYANDDHFWRDCYLTGTAPYFLKRSKTKMAFYKFEKTLEVQEKIVDMLKQNKYVNVREFVEDFKWQRVDEYKKTVEITYRSK